MWRARIRRPNEEIRAPRPHGDSDVAGGKKRRSKRGGTRSDRGEKVSLAGGSDPSSDR